MFKNFLIFTLCLVLSIPFYITAQSELDIQNDEGSTEVFDVIEFYQVDGSLIHIKGIREGKIYYTETKDGYTVVRNDDGIYEYAEVNSEGALVPGGTRANDPENRSSDEMSYLRGIDKHIRFQPPKLDEIENQGLHEFHKRTY